nr:MAG TPA: Baseplate wedge protein [Caudoviricetes sp.]
MLKMVMEIQGNRSKEGDLLAYDIALNIASNDLVIKNNDLILIDNAERVAQQVLITLRFWLGEWFLDTREGVPYLEYILVKNPNMSHIKQILTEKIKSVDGVNSIVSLNFDFRRIRRELYVDFEVNTDYGLITERAVLGYGGRD